MICAICGRNLELQSGYLLPPELYTKAAYPSRVMCEECNSVLRTGNTEGDGMKGQLSIDVPVGYEALGEVFVKALARTAHGKGKERHATDIEKFTDQISMQITREDGIGFPIGQAKKKLHEINQLDKPLHPIGVGSLAQTNELLDALVYISMAIIHLTEEA